LSSAEISKPGTILTTDHVDRTEDLNASTTLQIASSNTFLFPKVDQNGVPDEDLEAWVYQQFLDFGFSDKGFKGWAKVTKNMCFVRKERKEDIIVTVTKYVSVTLSMMTKA
jgi:hypothetical protein